MTYELAKQLKEAGFEQVDDEFRTINDPSGKLEWAYSPTLSELIEACPEDGTQLIHGVGSAWYAEFMNHSVMPYKRTHFVQGSTPEEAVAKLWLALKNANN